VGGTCLLNELAIHEANENPVWRPCCHLFDHYGQRHVNLAISQNIGARISCVYIDMVLVELFR